MKINGSTDASVAAGQISSKGHNLRASIYRAMNRIQVGLQSLIISKLQGPVLQHRSGKLTGSVRGQVEDHGDMISAVVTAGGGVAPYAAVHEYGGTFQIPDHLSHSKRGRAFTVRAHSATFPERSFMRSSLTEFRSRAEAELAKAAIEGLK